MMLACSMCATTFFFFLPDWVTMRDCCSVQDSWQLWRWLWNVYQTRLSEILLLQPELPRVRWRPLSQQALEAASSCGARCSSAAVTSQFYELPPGPAGSDHTAAWR